MYVVTFATQKGGSGKTTLCSALGVHAVARGLRVLLLDQDPQGSLLRWYEKRPADAPEVDTVPPPLLERALQGLRAKRFDWVLIDTQGADDAGTAAALQHADYCVVPCRPSAADLGALLPTLETIRRLKKPFGFVLTQTQPRGYRIRDASQSLGSVAAIAEQPMVLRNDYQDAFAEGLGPTELAPAGKAAAEIGALWDWLHSKLAKRRHVAAA